VAVLLRAKGWAMRDYIRRILGQGARLDPQAAQAVAAPVPVLWLLGKTGAGKSSLVRALTGLAEVGDGFAPCTRTARAFDFPAGRPVLRFLDTRGLGEAAYDPAEDLAEAELGSHAVLVIARIDDPVQGAVAGVLAELRRRRPRLPVLLAHSGADLLVDPGARDRALAANRATFEAAAGGRLEAVVLALPDGGPLQGLEALRGALAAMLPEVALLLEREEAQDAETRRFAELRPLVLWYAGAAGASDAAPLVGAVTVPALQGAMLHALARRHGVEWTASRAGAFAAALGSGILLRLAGGLALRQVAKLVPVVGQTLGAAASAGLGFAATFALGRAGSYWLHAAAQGRTVDAETLRARYRAALQGARDAPR